MIIGLDCIPFLFFSFLSKTSYVHKSFKSFTFPVLIWSKDEYLEPVGSPLYVDQDENLLSLSRHEINMANRGKIVNTR